MKLDEKIYRLGLMVLDELLLHRNSSKITEVTIEDASILSEMLVHVNPHAIFTFSELEIIEFYRERWTKKTNKNKVGEKK
jgi:hypothetical protein